ncbi:MAG: flippase-like domain-containing protein [Candidatus Aminicenantes bacterium]|nr:flippase-like domain-containing protein [Candidatus Aminicenantes bacterium]
MKTSNQKKGSNYKFLKIFLGVALTTLALWLSFRKLDWEGLKETFFQINFFWVILAAANSLFTVYALGWRWQILLNPKVKVPLTSLFRLNIISQFVNIVMPGRFGELARAYLASKQYKVSGAYVVGTIAIEKILDFFIFVFLWISVPVLFAMQKEVKGYKIALFLCFFMALFLILFIWQPKLFLKWTNLISRFLPAKFRQVFQDFFKKGIEAFRLLKNAKTLTILIIFTFIFVGGQVLTNYILFIAFDMKLSFWAGLVVLLALQVVNIPPSIPGKIGIYEYSVILALSIFSISKSQALSYGLMLHMVAYVPKILLGLIFLPSVDISLRKSSKLQVEKLG